MLLDFFNACFLDAVQLIQVLLVQLNVAIVDSETCPYLAKIERLLIELGKECVCVFDEFIIMSHCFLP